jgi:hypothetical protein
MVYRALYAFLVLLLAGCTGMGSGTSDGSDGPSPDTTAEETISGEMSEMTDEQGATGTEARELLSGTFGQGPARPEVRVASSASALTDDLGQEVPDRGSGAYVAAFWGRKNTGGYSLALSETREQAGQTVVLLSLKEPPKDAMVTQAITYPYVVVYVPGAEPGDISLADEAGRELDWRVAAVGGGG